MMIITAALLTRATFLWSVASTLYSSSRVLESSPPLPALQSSSILTNFYYTNPLNGVRFSSQLTEEERLKMMQLGARIARKRISSTISSQPSLAGSILRLAFHDATTREDLPGKKNQGIQFTGGPNGSIRYEIESRNENRGLSKPLQVVQSVFDEVYGLGLSFADTLAISGATAVEIAGGPNIPVKLGRNDVTVADPEELRHPLVGQTDRSKVTTTLPSAGLDSDGLRLFFGRLGLSEEEFVALFGAHDLGRHVSLIDMPKDCLKKLTRQCLEEAPVSVPFVTENPDTFSNTYFRKLLSWYSREVQLGEVAFIPTDVALVVDDGLRNYVVRFAKDQDDFFETFKRAYQKLVDVSATSLERY